MSSGLEQRSVWLAEDQVTAIMEMASNHHRSFSETLRLIVTKWEAFEKITARYATAETMQRRASAVRVAAAVAKRQPEFDDAWISDAGKNLYISVMEETGRRRPRHPRSAARRATGGRRTRVS